MTKGNRKFAIEAMKRGFLKRLEKAGIDPQLVDLSKYDWESFSTLDDLIEHYANYGDIVCKKLWERENYDEFVSQYLGQDQAQIPEEVIEAVLKHVREELADINVKYLNLESHVNDILNKIHSLQPNEPAISTVKLDLDKTFSELRNQLSELRERIRGLEDHIQNPRTQATLTKYVSDNCGEGETVSVENLIEPVKGHKENNGENDKAKRKTGFSFGHFALVNIMGFIISLIAADILHVNMFMFYLIFMAMAFLDGLIWGGAWGRGNRKSTRAFATGYMYSQYTNPYKAGRGR